ncbi:hypothetical protein B0H14DRAFT_3424632 [Mycena olivaceomarginata]|nr:hypothetical protein B0H14DRAFT_3424632 [Mycena olivaceomarginata]
MAPQSWASTEQTLYLKSWIPEFMRRQAERKIHLFWPSMFGEWFQKYPEHVELNLPLPSDPAVDSLTAAQIEQLGVGIKDRKQKLQNWFRYQRSKINQADPAAKHSQAAKLDALIAALVQAKAKPRRRASQAIEVFQRRNRALISERLVAEGYDALRSEPDDADDWVEESDGTDAAQRKSTKSLRMRMRTRVVQALWKEASVEEQKAVAAQVEKEREEIREAELRDEEKGSEPQTPAQLQDGIDALEGLFTKVHGAAYVASNWVGMTIVGGPNPRLGGDLSMKIICHGETPESNDFQDSCVDFNKHIVEAFEGFLQLVFSPSECRARAFEPREAENDPLRPATVIPPPSPEELAPPPAKKTAKKKTTSRKVVTQTPPAGTATSALNVPMPLPDTEAPVASDVCAHTLASIPIDTTDSSEPSDLDRDLADTQDINIDFEVDFGAEKPGTFETDVSDASTSSVPDAAPAWPVGMTAPLAPAAAAALASIERGGTPAGPTMAIDPRLVALSVSAIHPPSPLASLTGPSASDWAKPSLLFEAFRRPPAPPSSHLRPFIPRPVLPPSSAVSPTRAARTLQFLLGKDALGTLPPSVVAPTPPASIALVAPTPPASTALVAPTPPASIALVVPKSRPSAKPLEDATPKTKGRLAGKGKAVALPETEAVLAAATEPVKRKRGRPPKAQQQLADVTNVEQTVEDGVAVLCNVVGNNRAAARRAAMEEKATKLKAAADAHAAQRAKGWIPGPEGSVVLLAPRTRRPPVHFDGTVAQTSQKPKTVVPMLDASERALLARATRKRKADADHGAAPKKRRVAAKAK